MISPEKMSALQQAYEDRLDRELEKLLTEDDEDNYCSGDCETCDVPYCECKVDDD